MKRRRIGWRAIGRSVPNAISLLRLAAAPGPLASVACADQDLFAWLLLGPA